MSESERSAYDAHIDNIMVQDDVLETARFEGRTEGLLEGRAEGLAEGREEERMKIAQNLKEMGLSEDAIAKVIGLMPD